MQYEREQKAVLLPMKSMLNTLERLVKQALNKLLFKRGRINYESLGKNIKDSALILLFNCF